MKTQISDYVSTALLVALPKSIGVPVRLVLAAQAIIVIVLTDRMP